MEGGAGCGEGGAVEWSEGIKRIGRFEDVPGREGGRGTLLRRDFGATTTTTTIYSTQSRASAHKMGDVANQQATLHCGCKTSVPHGDRKKIRAQQFWYS